MASDNITADDVAQAAGVSRWTVNRAFKAAASISPETRRRVIEAADALGYVPDLRAAALASDRSRLIALLIDDFANPHKLVMLERLTDTLQRHGWDTLLVNTLGKIDAGDAMRKARQRRVDATVLIGIQFSDEMLAAAGSARLLRKLIIFARNSQNPDTISIAVDDRAATHDIAGYILKRGYRRPMFLAGPRTISAHLSRKETFVRFWQNSTGHAPETADVDGYDPALATELLAGLLAGRPRAALPDVIACENDALALGAVDCIRHRLGLRVPDDIAVTGLDDIPQAAGAGYRLTTYRQPIRDMAEYLVEVLESRETTQLSRTFTGRLVVRESA